MSTLLGGAVAESNGIVVLVFEDEENNQNIIMRRLMKRGYESLLATNGAEGLELAEKAERIDIILMDFQMPGENGIEITRKLKANPKLADIPVIAVSANIDYKIKNELDDVGFDGYCLKPIDFDKLFRMMLGLLRARHADPAS